jgi:hypothetical protein
MAKPIIDLTAARTYGSAPPPTGDERSDHFLELMAECCRADQPALAARLRRFAAEYRAQDEGPDAALSALAGFYPVELSARIRANLVASDMATFTTLKSPTPSSKNDAIGAFLRLNGGRALGAEAIRKRLAE